MNRFVFKNLYKDFNNRYWFLPGVFGIIPASVFYIYFYRDLLNLNYTNAYNRNKSKIKIIDDNAKIVFFEDGNTHQSLLPFFEQVPNSQIVILENPGAMSYRSEFIEFVTNHDFSNCDTIHILTLENLIYAKKSVLDKFKKLPQRKTATLHMYMHDEEMKFLSDYFDQLIVFNEIQRNHLESIGVYNSVVIPHPSHTIEIPTPNKGDIRRLYNIPENKLILSVAGHLRIDKGINFLINSLNKLDKIYKNKIFLNFSGKPIDIKNDYLINRILELDIESRIELKSDQLSKAELVDNIVLSDYFLLPYDRKFKNTSAQLIECAVHDILVIASDYSPLGEEVIQNNLGYVFKSGDTNSLLNLLKDILGNKIITPKPIPIFKELFDNKSITKKINAFFNYST